MEVSVSRWFSTRVEWIALVKENLNLEWTGVRGHRLLNLMNLYNARLITKSLDSVWLGNQSEQKATELSIFPFKSDFAEWWRITRKKFKSKKSFWRRGHDSLEKLTVTWKPEREVNLIFCMQDNEKSFV